MIQSIFHSMRGDAQCRVFFMMMRTERLAHERRNMLQSKLLSLIGVRQRFAEKAGAATKKER